MTAIAIELFEIGEVFAFAERGGSAAPAFPPASYEPLRAARTAWDPGERFVASHRIEPR